MTRMALSRNHAVDQFDLKQPVDSIELASPARNTIRVFLGSPQSAASQYLVSSLNVRLHGSGQDKADYKGFEGHAGDEVIPCTEVVLRPTSANLACQCEVYGLTPSNDEELLSVLYTPDLGAIPE